METYMVLCRFTEQGLRDVKDTLNRRDMLLKEAEASGLTVKALYYLRGPYDLLIVVEAPNDVVMQAASYVVRARGHLEINVYQAFTEADMERVIELLP